MAGFVTSLSDGDAVTLLKRFAPHVWLHSEEQNFPCPVDWYLQFTSLGYATQIGPGFTTTTVVDSVTTQTLATQVYDGHLSGGALQGAEPADDHFFVTPINDADAATAEAGWVPPAGGYDDPGNTPPVYGGVIDRTDSTGQVIGWDLVYGFFYGYNGKAMNDPGLGTHESDLEHVVVRVDGDQQTLLAVYYRQHASDDRYNGWYYPPGPDTPQAGGILFQTGTKSNGSPDPQRCVAYSALESHASYPRDVDDWTYGPLRGTDEVDQGYAWDTAQNVVLMNDLTACPWLDYSGRLGAAPTASVVFSRPPTTPIVQHWQVARTDGPFIEQEIYCSHISGQKSRISGFDNFDIAQVPLTWTFDDPDDWLSAAQLGRIQVNLTHDVHGGNDQRAISGILNGSATTPPYAHTDNVYFSGLVYTDENGNQHTGYDDAWNAMLSESTAPTGSTLTFRVVIQWGADPTAAHPGTSPVMEDPIDPRVQAAQLGRPEPPGLD